MGGTACLRNAEREFLVSACTSRTVSPAGYHAYAVKEYRYVGSEAPRVHIKRTPFQRFLAFEGSLTVRITERRFCETYFNCGYVPRGPLLDRYGDALVSLDFRVCCGVFSVPN